LPNYSPNAISAYKLSQSVLKGSVGLTGYDIDMVNRIIPGVNGGYALGDIDQTGAITTSDALQFLRVHSGVATEEIKQRAGEIRNAISKYMAEEAQNGGNEWQNIPVLLMQDLDVHLIIDALKWWRDYGGPYIARLSWDVDANP